eukprot:Blabericola_migrator_1__8047@NODE_412_length_8716_cov_285_566539_g325_i0_p5_GENE_NODE_412_length_8716_cov_285_566539_g325_i0NODE_412_length_8716_cov_285_566539_g325_i0_p5_ORF_typecomplete_len130_score35_64Methyltransf_31/PF13847_6/0_014_NODE_412_length_8716_cov_285_566539_g325_i023782767
MSHVSFCVDDILSPDTSDTCDEDREVKDQIEGAKYDYIHDKGTLDVFILKRCPEIYPIRLLDKYVRQGTVVTVTSSNYTTEELVSLFDTAKTNQMGFRVLDIMDTIPGFTYGGVEGRPVSTVTFQVVSV